MKNILLTTIFSLLMGNILAQAEKAEGKAVADDFEKNFNAGNFESIFAQFDANMQKALPLPKAVDLFSGLKTQAGKITKRSFVKYEQSYASYKTVFERGVFSLNISSDQDAKINGLSVKPYKENDAPKPTRNTSSLSLPFKGEWTVIWGGDTKELNYHVSNEAQKNAFDIVIQNKDGKSYKTDGSTNEDFYAFGQEIIAPCAGKVVLVVDGVKDNKPGELNPIYIPGNTVIIRTTKNEYLFFAHFEQHSIKVRQGQQVTAGELLGLCGNSGNSSEPHLHFHIQNVEDMVSATGIKCYFDKLIVNGQLKTDYSPVKADVISTQ